MALRKFLFLESTEGFHEEQAVTDELELGKLSLSGISGVSIDGGGARAVNFSDPINAQDLVTKIYADSIVSGLDTKASVRLATDSALPSSVYANGPGTITGTFNGALSVDGVPVAVGNRILVKDQVSGLENGIYTVSQTGDGASAFILTRAIDANSDAEVTAGLFAFVEEGSINAESGWILITDNAITLGTTALTFTQFTGLGQIVAGDGLFKVANTIHIGDGPGILVSTDKIEVELAANPALEFDTAGDGGKLRWFPDTTRGLNRDAAGAHIVLSAYPGLQFDSGALETTRAPEISKKFTASGAIAIGDAVYWSANNVVSTGDSSVDAKSRIIGLAKANISGGSSGEIINHGSLPSVLSGAVANTPYYLGTTGQPVLFASIGAANRVIRLGFALNATDLWVEIFDYGKKAA